MPHAIIVSLTDLGRNFRIIQHAKSFATEGIQVELIGFNISGVPREILRNPLIRFHQFPCWFKLPPTVTFIFFPFVFLLYSFLALAISFQFRGVDYLLYSLHPLILQFWFAKILKLTLRESGKVILDIDEWKNPQKTQSFLAFCCHSLENLCSKKGDFIISPNRVIQVMLQIQKIPSALIRSDVGVLYHGITNNTDFLSIKESVNEFLGIPHQGYSLISVPLHEAGERTINSFFKLIEKLDGAQIAFVVFANSKTQQTLIEKIQKAAPKTVLLRFVSVNTDAYAHVIAASDVGLVYQGSKKGFDISPELYQYLTCSVPVVTFEFGCIREIIKEGQTGFIFKNEEQLLNLIQSIFIRREIDLKQMKVACGKILLPWSESWKIAFSSFLLDRH